MRVAITGSAGLIGQALVADLLGDSHQVIHMVRREPTAPGEVRWDPATGDVDIGGLAGVDAIVHLAGAGVGDHRWTDSYKKEILDSRVLGTTAIACAAAEMSPHPRVLVCASATGYYGDRGNTILDESASKGIGFLSDVVADWEAAADPARHAGIRVVHARSGLVVSDKGGAWKRLIKQFRFGVGGRLGSGDQYWSFMSLKDEIKALRMLINNGSLEGPINLTAPNPVTNREATRELARLVHRPAFVNVPAFALKTALGEFSIEALSSARVIPAKLQAAGFSWSEPTITEALRACL